MFTVVINVDPPSHRLSLLLPSAPPTARKRSLVHGIPFRGVFILAHANPHTTVVRECRAHGDTVAYDRTRTKRRVFASVDRARRVLLSYPVGEPFRYVAKTYRLRVHDNAVRHEPRRVSHPGELLFNFETSSLVRSS